MLALGLVIGAGALVLAQPAAAKIKVDAALMQTLDPDKDGTVDLNEVRTAAASEFRKLDKDNDGTLDAKELKGVLKKGAIKNADPDNDGTLDLNEYTAVVEKDFKAADHNNDGKLTEADLKSKKGRKLLKLI